MKPSALYSNSRSRRHLKPQQNVSLLAKYFPCVRAEVEMLWSKRQAKKKHPHNTSSYSYQLARVIQTSLPDGIFPQLDTIIIMEN